MKYFIGVLHTNRLDLLKDVLKGLEDCGRIVVVDNSENHELLDYMNPNTNFIKPYTPLSFSQSMNFFIQLAIRRNCDVFFLCHEDIKINNKTFFQLLERAEANKDWGMLLTNEDSFSAYRTEAVGNLRFDPRLPDYFADTDFQYWLGKKHKIVQTDIEVFHYRSQTILSDEKKNIINSITYPLYASYYEQKTGGKRGSEKFDIPFNNKLFA